MAIERPNILILMADQMTAGILPAYGNTVARTPHLDALAQGGVVFENAYCNSPLCAPSRAVFMSGRLPSATGAYDNAADFPAQVPTFAHVLRATGYRTILTGKMHLCGPDQLHGFEERLTTDIYPADFGWTPDWSQPDARPEWYHSMDSVTQAGPCVRTNQLDFDEEVMFTARQKLFDIARQPDPRPFCMVVSLTHPHDPFTITQPYWDRYGDAEIDRPAVAEAPRDPHSARLRHVIGLDLQGVTEAQTQAARRAYYGAVSFVDDQLGAIQATLAETGMAGNTIIVVLSDHGEMLGERGLWFKMSFFEAACRIPLIVHAPARFVPGRIAASVSLVDILPTLADLAGAAPVAATDGHSLLPHLIGEGGHDGVTGEYLAEGVVAPMLMLRRGTLKFIHTPGDPDQLFDLATDPHELANLATEATAASWRAEIAARWDLPRLHADVLASQQRRQFVNAALNAGVANAWDHQPVRDARKMFVRSHMKLDDIEAMARFPRVPQ